MPRKENLLDAGLNASNDFTRLRSYLVAVDLTLSWLPCRVYLLQNFHLQAPGFKRNKIPHNDPNIILFKRQRGRMVICFL